MKHFFLSSRLLCSPCFVGVLFGSAWCCAQESNVNERSPDLSLFKSSESLPYEQSAADNGASLDTGSIENLSEEKRSYLIAVDTLRAVLAQSILTAEQRSVVIDTWRSQNVRLLKATETSRNSKPPVPANSPALFFPEGTNTHSVPGKEDDLTNKIRALEVKKIESRNLIHSASVTAERRAELVDSLIKIDKARSAELEKLKRKKIDRERGLQVDRPVENLTGSSEEAAATEAKLREIHHKISELNPQERSEFVESQKNRILQENRGLSENQTREVELPKQNQNEK